MLLPIEKPSNCEEMCTTINFLSAQGMKAAEIHHEISQVYDENIMSNGMIWKWVRVFKDGYMNVYHMEQSGGTSFIAEDLVQKVDEKIKNNRCFTISSSNEFLQVLRSVLCEIVTRCLHYRKLC